MVVYLPLAFMKDWICNLLKRRSLKNNKTVESINEFYSGISSPLRCNSGQNSFELELHGTLTRKDSTADLLPQEEGRPLVSRLKEDLRASKQDGDLTTREIAKCGFYIAPIWFVTEVGNYLG